MKKTNSGSESNPGSEPMISKYKGENAGQIILSVEKNVSSDIENTCMSRCLLGI